MKCWYCEVLGHTAKECCKKKADLKRKEVASDVDPKSGAANVAIGELFFTEHCSAYAATSGELGWYVDSGASKHMSNTKEWLQTMEVVLADSKVIVGDN